MPAFLSDAKYHAFIRYNAVFLPTENNSRSDLKVFTRLYFMESVKRMAT